MRLFMICALLIAVVTIYLLNTASHENVKQSNINVFSKEDSMETVTNLEGIDLNDTTEDPDYAEAGEELAREASLGAIGKVAPLAKFKTIDGQIIDLANIYGKKPVYIKFWATWCIPCRQQMPGFQNTYESFGDKIEIIAVNIGFSDDEASVRAFIDKYKLTMPIVMDNGRLAKLFHLNVTPQHVLIGKNTKIAYIGHAENKQLENAIQEVISEPNPDATATAANVEIDRIVSLGGLVPDISIKLLNGDNIHLKAQPGRLLAIEFFSSWCEWYLETSRPATSKACTRVREEIEKIIITTLTVDWIGISGGPWATEQDLLAYKKNHNISIPLALDKSDSLFRTFAIRDIPTIVLINDSGQLIRLIGPKQTNILEVIQSAITEVSK